LFQNTRMNNMRSAVSALLATACYWVVFTPTTCLSFTPPSQQQWGMQTRRSPLVIMKQEKEGSAFSIANLFGGQQSGTTASTLRGTKNLEPHPSVRPHISPLNRLGADKSKEPAAEHPLPMHPDVRSGVLPNGLPYIILPNKSPPGRFEAHLQVFSGSCE
jgi:hypothetical protein